MVGSRAARESCFSIWIIASSRWSNKANGITCLSFAPPLWRQCALGKVSFLHVLQLFYHGFLVALLSQDVRQLPYPLLLVVVSFLIGIFSSYLWFLQNGQNSLLHLWLDYSQKEQEFSVLLCGILPERSVHPMYEPLQEHKLRNLPPRTYG